MSRFTTAPTSESWMVVRSAGAVGTYSRSSHLGLYQRSSLPVLLR